MEKSYFAKNLIALRKAKGVSQRDLSKKTGISTRMIAYYEGRSSIPNISILRKLAEALDGTVSELVEPNESEKKNGNLNTRTIKKVKIIEQLPPEDQRKVIEFASALIAKNREKSPIKQDNRH